MGLKIPRDYSHAGARPVSGTQGTNQALTHIFTFRDVALG